MTEAETAAVDPFIDIEVDDNNEELFPKLENCWCFWHDKFVVGGKEVSEYEAAINPICTFSSIPKFWMIFNHLPPVDALQPKSSYHLMKTGVKPLWEDPANADGGFWAMRIAKEDAQMVWRELVMACVGEQFAPFLDKDDDITGVTISVRQFDDIVQLWNRNSACAEHLFSHMRHFVPNVQFKTPYYKACRDHSDFKPSNNNNNSSSV